MYLFFLEEIMQYPHLFVSLLDCVVSDRLGVKDIVINVSYLREQIKQALKNGESYGVRIYYSEEEEALETGGGILQALPLLGAGPFIVLSGDVISAYPLQQLLTHPEKLAHIVLVDNPAFNPEGDFYLDGCEVRCGKSSTLTYANIGLYHPALFKNYTPGKFGLGDVLKKAIQLEQVTGEYYNGLWYNLGTEEQLLELSEARHILPLTLL